MKLNQHTIDTLKNFAGINTNILIKEGDELSTISTMRNIFAKAKISDQFTKKSLRPSKNRHSSNV